MSDQAAAPTDSAPVEAPAPAAESTAPATDNAALLSRMDELAQSVQALAPKQEQGFAELAGQPFDPYAGQPGEYEDPWAGQEFQQEQQPADIEALVQQALAQRLDPYIAQQQHERTVQQAEALQERYPALKDGAVAGPLVNEARQMAQQIGYSSGFTPQQIASLANSPAFIEKLHLANLAKQQGQQETPADASTVRLEGSAAQVDTPAEDPADRIVNAGRHNGGFGWM